ncbi:nucleotide exchange factor GrpE [Undibacterium sp. RuRC25W]|uniref:nucleotide exchange factor GrpE n=1 Tax=Undibacterium sp. RuRC25W TaxID=3413047 RepID=UPI003BEFDB8F
MQEQEKRVTTEDIPMSDDSAASPLAIDDSRLVVQLELAKKKLAESSDALLRVRADAENSRRRFNEDLEKSRKFAIESFAESMVPVKDSLEMALMLDWPSFEAIREGVEITLKQLNAAFERHGLKEITPQRGEKIDPAIHQAVALISTGEQASDTVVSVLQKGYMLADRLLRPAIVTAAQTPTM